MHLIREEEVRLWRLILCGESKSKARSRTQSQRRKTSQSQLQEPHVRLLRRTNMGHPEVKSKIKSEVESNSTQELKCDHPPVIQSAFKSTAVHAKPAEDQIQNKENSS
jgi:hypothetical protein